MQVRNAIAAVSVAALAFALAACTSDPASSPSDAPNTTSPAASPTASATPEPTAPGPDPAAVKIRDVAPGYDLAGTATSLRTGFPSFAELSDEEIAVVLNAGCDGMDATSTPEGGADAIVAYGIEAGDAVWGVLAAVTLYCPEYSAFLGSA